MIRPASIPATDRCLPLPGPRPEPRIDVVAEIPSFHASPWSFQEEAWKELRAGNCGLEADDPKVTQRKSRNLARRVRDMLASAPQDPDATAWVCVNEEVAEIVSSLFRKRGTVPAPYLISFDNSAASYRLGIDSFVFDARALARAMLFHLTRPSAAVFPGHELVDLEVGWKGSSPPGSYIFRGLLCIRLSVPHQWVDFLLERAAV